MTYREQTDTDATVYELNRTKGCLDKPEKYENLRDLERVLRKAPSNDLLIDTKHIFCTLEGSVHNF